MRGSVLLLVLSFALAGTPAQAESITLESARKDAVAARARMNDVRARQMALRSELNQLAGQIEALKARQKGALLKGGELGSSLRRSQELSDLLTEAAQELSRAEADLERGNLALMSQLSGELESLRARWDQTPDRAARGELLRQMRELRAERAQVYAMLPAGRIPALEVRGSDDPEDLLEQANALRDSEDKIRQQMRALGARIAEVRRERALERRMSDFLGEEALFDEHDRRLRRATTSSSRLFGGEPQTTDATPVPPMSATAGPATPTPISPEAGASTVKSAPPTPPPATAPAQTAPIEFSTLRSDGRTVLGSGALVVDDGDSRELPALEAKLKKLQSLAKQIDERADAIEARARESR
jgi:hypothetical protein